MPRSLLCVCLVGSEEKTNANGMGKIIDEFVASGFCYFRNITKAGF